MQQVFLHLPVASVKLSLMGSRLRCLMIVLLCCLLPVQGAMAFARAVGMLSHHARPVQATSAPTATETMPSVAHHSPEPHTNRHAHPAAKADTAKPASMPHSPASCTDCAKCCMVGAAAPPPAEMPAAIMTAALDICLPTDPETGSHIPEKPERPPRHG